LCACGSASPRFGKAPTTSSTLSDCHFWTKMFGSAPRPSLVPLRGLSTQGHFAWIAHWGSARFLLGICFSNSRHPHSSWDLSSCIRPLKWTTGSRIGSNSIFGARWTFSYAWRWVWAGSSSSCPFWVCWFSCLSAFPGLGRRTRTLHCRLGSLIFDRRTRCPWVQARVEVDLVWSNFPHFVPNSPSVRLPPLRGGLNWSWRCTLSETS